MKQSRLVSILIAAFVLVLSVDVQAQTLPDLTGQEKVIYELQAVLNGKDVNLQLDKYYYIDWENLKQHFVSLLNNEIGEPWLAIHREEVGERLSDGVVATKETHLYLFENVNGKWLLVKEFQLNSDVQSEFDELLKSKYQLEIK